MYSGPWQLARFNYRGNSHDLVLLDVSKELEKRFFFYIDIFLFGAQWLCGTTFVSIK